MSTARTPVTAPELSRDQVLAHLRAEDVLSKLAQQFREEYAKLAGSVSFFRKGDGSISSDFEANAERTVGESLALVTPWASVYGEEGFSFSATTKQSPFAWYIDPIDGSISFRHGLDTFSFVATLAENDIPLATVIYFPRLNREYQATLGGGVWSEGRRIQMAAPADLSSIVVAASDEYTFGLVDRNRLLQTVRTEFTIVREYTDLYGHSLVAQGACAVKFDAACARWDRLPAELLCREAGARTMFIPTASPNYDLEGSLISYHPLLEQRVLEVLHMADLREG